MTKKLSQRILHKEIRTNDFQLIISRFTGDSDGLQECFQMIEAEILRIQKAPDKMGKFCEYDPLRAAGFRKVKLFSSRQLQKSGAKTDLRILYRHNQANNSVEVLAICFRIKDKPRPPEDPYSVAENRDFNF